MAGRFAHIRLPVAALAAVLALAGTLAAQSPRQGGAVDVVLIIAIDVSASVDRDEYQLMREGLARALTTRQVARAIARGRTGAIGVSVVQWSGYTEQKIKVGWTRVSSAGDLLAVAGKVRTMARRYKGGATDIGGAIAYCRAMILSAPFKTTRMVIDMAGDGTNNVNRSPHFERDKTIAPGIVINGLAVTAGADALAGYYRRYVAGGNGSFVETARGYGDFERAMVRKLVREIGAAYLF